MWMRTDWTSGGYRLSKRHVCCSRQRTDSINSARSLCATIRRPPTSLTCGWKRRAGQSVSDHLGLGRAVRHSQLMGDERFRPFIIVHELGHLIYDLFDEYVGDGGAAECLGGTTSNACIMESSASDGDRFGNAGGGGPLVSGRVRRFCVTSNHDPDGDTRQDQRRAEACWISMRDNHPDLSVPAGFPVGADQADADAIAWTVLQSDPRFALVIDRSGSMQGNKLAQAKIGAEFAR